MQNRRLLNARFELFVPLSTCFQTAPEISPRLQLFAKRRKVSRENVRHPSRRQKVELLLLSGATGRGKRQKRKLLQVQDDYQNT